MCAGKIKNYTAHITIIMVSVLLLNYYFTEKNCNTTHWPSHRLQQRL